MSIPKTSQTSSQTAPALFDLEKEIATLILDKLEHLEITPERAAEIARFALSTLPENLTDDQVKQIIPSLDDHFYELAEVVHKHLVSAEANKETIQKEAEQLLKQGKIDEANQLMKQFFARKLS